MNWQNNKKVEVGAIKIYFKDSRKMSEIPDNSVQLVVTSPPYPLVPTWNQSFSLMNIKIMEALASEKYDTTFQLMHEELAKVWRECYRVLERDGFLAINIGDVILNGKFYSNHTKVIDHCEDIGFNLYKIIIWQKKYPEFILIFRKGKVDIDYRNYMEVWKIKPDRNHYGRKVYAFPLEIPMKIIQQYSKPGDTVLDPFTGSATTAIAAAKLGRKFIGYEIDQSLLPVIVKKVLSYFEIGGGKNEF